LQVKRAQTPNKTFGTSGHARRVVTIATRILWGTAGSCGIETFQLYKMGSDWKIVNFADTHSEDCP